MGTMNPNQTLLQGEHQTPSDTTPAPLSGSSRYVSFAIKDVPPPAELYVDVDDALVVQAASSATSETVTVNVRLLLPNGRLEDMQFIIRPASTRTVLRQAFGLAEGFLLSISAVASVAITRGQTFARILLQRGASGTGQPGQVLFSDYVTTFACPAYPNGRSLAPTDGPGLIYSPAIGNPGAGADWTVTVPTNARWRVQCFEASLTTAVAVANRIVQVQAFIGGNLIYDGAAAQALTASSAGRVSGAQLTPWTSASLVNISVPLPPNLVLTPTLGFSATFGVVTLNLQAADQWNFIGLLVEEWLDNV